MLLLSFILQFLIAAIFGILFWQIFSGRYEGDKIERSLRFRIGEYTIHFHHWLWSSVIFAVFLLNKIYNPIVLGLLSGSIVQGLSYKDRFLIIYKSTDFERLYAR